MNISLPQCSHCHRIASITYDFSIRSSVNKVNPDSTTRSEITDKINLSGLCLDCLTKYLHYIESVATDNPGRVQLLQDHDPVILELDSIVPDDDLPF